MAKNMVVAMMTIHDYANADDDGAGDDDDDDHD